MKNPFNPRDVADFNLKRNAFDMSKHQLFTTDWGKIYPACCYEVIPGDTFRIKDTTVNFRGMNTLFPILSRVRASVSWFYVRNRVLYKDWEDFIFGTKEGLTPPYLGIKVANVDRIKTGSLADALGLPTTFGTSNENVYSTISYGTYLNLPDTFQQGGSTQVVGVSTGNVNELDYVLSRLNNGVAPYTFMSDNNLRIYSLSTAPLSSIPSSIEFNNSNGYKVVIALCYNYRSRDNGPIFTKCIRALAVDSVGTSSYSSYSLAGFSDIDFVEGMYFVVYCRSSFSLVGRYLNVNVNSLKDVSQFPNLQNIPFVSSGILGDEKPTIPINALPFRAYEMICNYYYRYDLNNPYRINGEPQYNQFIPTTDGGRDENEYTFHFRNYELDAFTSALQTPQFGAAPLVGLSYQVGSLSEGDEVLDTATFKFEDSEGKTYNATLGVKGDRLVSIANFSQDIPSANLRQLQSYVDYGFSINMLRNVNSFQRFLENTMRRGLRYRNQLKSHFGVSVDYPDIDVPEYLGGFSGFLNSSQITNMSQTGDVGLGDFIGQLGGSISTSHSINKYCPEHGFIMCLVSVTPSPLYPQACEKYLLKHDKFDYYQSEFGKIGYVPIHYDEVQPLNFDPRDKQLPSDVFGYQRAWYDYMMQRDSSHGDFRLALRDFSLQRTFANRPELIEDFTQVKPDDLNHIFINRNIATQYGSTAKFLCSCYVDAIAERPIPRHGVPSLE